MDAEVLQVSIASINRYVKAGTLRAFKIGKRLVRIDPASVEALLQVAPATAPEEWPCVGTYLPASGTERFTTAAASRL